MYINRLEADIFKAMAHPLRIKVLKILRNEEKCVCEITEDEAFSQSNLSQHLRVLKDAGLVTQRKEGLKVYYRIKDDRVITMIGLADAMIKANVEAIGEALSD